LLAQRETKGKTSKIKKGETEIEIVRSREKTIDKLIGRLIEKETHDRETIERDRRKELKGHKDNLKDPQI
jgi:hypothetical protein